MNISSAKRLRNGVMMPLLGFGVFRASDKEAEQAVLWALEARYRHIDTARFYHNEAGVGRAVRASGIPRKDIFVTTKLWNDDMRAGRQREAFDASLKGLSLDYVDLYLIHWPVENFVQTWDIMDEFYESGRAKAIGVSNFQAHHLDTLYQATGKIPMVNQIESHPFLSQKPLMAYCAEKGIVCQAWSPLGGDGGKLLNEKTIVDLAQKHGKTPAQIILRWDVQRGIVPLPKSVHKDRISSNIEIFNFKLDDNDMAAIDAMNKDKRFGSNPDNFNF